MITTVTGNLLDSTAQTFVNPVNTVGVMGKGLARAFKHNYPDMFAQYKHYCDDGRLDIGKLHLYKTSAKWILNFPTKKHWRSKSKLEYIELGLQKFVDTYEQQGITSIAFPQLGCGLGGLLWDDVRPVMERYLNDLPIDVFIYDFGR